jgi:hypothetical protein
VSLIEQGAALDWFQVKQWLSTATNLHSDSLHVHAGVLGQLAVALVLRKSLSSVWPWLAVAAAAVGNEVYDFTVEVWAIREEQFLGCVKDVWNTLLLPTVLLLATRFAPRLFAGPPSVADAGEPGEQGRQAGE